MDLGRISWLSEYLKDELLVCQSVYPEIIDSIKLVPHHQQPGNGVEHDPQQEVAVTLKFTESQYIVLALKTLSSSIKVLECFGLEPSSVNRIISTEPTSLYDAIGNLIDLINNVNSKRHIIQTEPAVKPEIETNRNIDKESNKNPDKETNKSSRHWTESEPIHDRKSVFIAHSTQIFSEHEAQEAIEELIGSNKKIQKATHNMYAYRYIDTKTSRPCHNNDDDGESAAGSRLAHLLELMGVTNVLVVVSRWYGGVQLGPDRFKHINVSARDAIQQLIPDQVAAAAASKKPHHHHRR